MKSQVSGGKIWDVIVIGGGPAGMMAAARAGERGRAVLLLEKNNQPGVKLSMTGGGRCNVTNNKPEVRTMLANYKDAGKFLFSTFTQHGVAETIAWFGEQGVVFHEENEGRLFPITNSAETIRETLIAATKQSGVVVHTNTIVSGVTHDTSTTLFTVTLSSGEVFHSHSCVIATGGTSKPETGSTGDGFTWAASLGHTIQKNSLALVPLTLKDTWVSQVSGVTLSDIKIILYANGKKQQSRLGKILFTHVGVSGPTVLNMSSTVKELLTKGEVTLVLDLFPKFDEGALRTYIHALFATDSNRKLKNILPEILPRTLTTIILELLVLDGETPGHSVRSEDRVKLVAFLKHFPLTVSGLLGADKAIVSSGGVSPTEIDFKTMGSRIVPNLYLVGDMLDIDRPSGGYSLQLCWSTGYVAGDHA
jgi:predicted Rossmann fold flavoprotein